MTLSANPGEPEKTGFDRMNDSRAGSGRLVNQAAHCTSSGVLLRRAAPGPGMSLGLVTGSLDLPAFVQSSPAP